MASGIRRRSRQAKGCHPPAPLLVGPVWASSLARHSAGISRPIERLGGTGPVKFPCPLASNRTISGGRWPSTVRYATQILSTIKKGNPSAPEADLAGHGETPRQHTWCRGIDGVFVPR